MPSLEPIKRAPAAPARRSRKAKLDDLRAMGRDLGRTMGVGSILILQAGGDGAERGEYLKRHLAETAAALFRAGCAPREVAAMEVAYLAEHQALMDAAGEINALRLEAALERQRAAEFATATPIGTA